MKNKINIADLLRNCPKGMELDCTTWENVTFEKVMDNKIFIRRNDKPSFDNTVVLNKYGCTTDYLDEKCRIFPKGKTTWEGFHRPFVEGDIVSTESGMYIGIVKSTEDSHHCYTFCSINNEGDFFIDVNFSFSRFASEDEKAKLFQAIKDNGYKWNLKTKTLEKLVTIFKVGNKIKLKNAYAKKYNDFNIRKITEIKHSHYILDDEQATPLSNQYLYELVPNKFDISNLKPFESRVLMRSSDAREWVATFYSHYSNNKFYGCGMCCDQCIPFEGNEHLLGTTADCDNFFKVWEES